MGQLTPRMGATAGRRPTTQKATLGFPPPLACLKWHVRRSVWRLGRCRWWRAAGRLMATTRGAPARWEQLPPGFA